MIDFGLAPCPLCGGEAEVVRLQQNAEQLSAVIKCSDCGLTLELETEYTETYSRATGERKRIKTSLDPIEAWNRRVSCEEYCTDCGYKAHSEAVAKLSNCNDCGLRNICEHVPQPGHMARINCPLWKAEEKEDD